MAVASLTWADGVDGISVINKVESTGPRAEFKGTLESAVWEMRTLGHSGSSG